MKSLINDLCINRSGCCVFRFSDLWEVAGSLGCTVVLLRFEGGFVIFGRFCGLGKIKNCYRFRDMGTLFAGHVGRVFLLCVWGPVKLFLGKISKEN